MEGGERLVVGMKVRVGLLKALVKGVVGLGLLTLLTGCATTSVFKSYTAQLGPVRGMIADGKLEEAYNQVSPKTKSADKILYLEERARIGQLSGHIDWSIEDYEAAAKEIEKNQLKSFDLGSAAFSLFSNDNVIPYRGFGYEKVFIHSFQAMNYLELGKLEDAMVEVRRANNEQQFSLQLHEKEVVAAEQAAKQNKIGDYGDNADYNKAYKQMKYAAGEVKNSFQNAFSHYLSGILYEAEGDGDNAYISYKMALEIAPNNLFAVNSVFRLAKKLQFQDDLEHFKAVFGDVQPMEPKAGEGRLVVVYEDGFVPEKKELFIPFFWGGRTYTIAMPFYNDEKPAIYPLCLSTDGYDIGKTEVICAARALAVKALEEDFSAIFIRQILRIIVKDQIQRQANKEGGSILGLVAAVGSLLSEKADRRSWLTLPDNVQVADYYLVAGEYTFNLIQALAAPSRVQISLKPGKTTVLSVIRTGASFYTRVIEVRE